MADNLLFEMTQESQQISEPFVSKQWVYCVDNNGGVYQNQVLLDTASLSNSGKYCHMGESVFIFPLVLTLTSDAGTNISAYNGAFACGLKNGYWNLLHSYSIEYNNTTVQNLTPFSNIYINYKMMTSMSQDDVHKNGPSLGFFPDSCTSFGSNFNDANGYYLVLENPSSDSNIANGLGITNNRDCGVFSLGFPSSINGVIPASSAEVVATQDDGTAFDNAVLGADGNALHTYFKVNRNRIGRLAGAGGANVADADVSLTINTTNQSLAGGWTGDRANLGFYKRQQNIAFEYDKDYYTTGLISQENATSVLGKNTFVSGLQKSTANDTIAWYILAKIRGKDMSDFLDKLGLIKGAFLRFQINLNTATHKIQYTRRVNANAGGNNSALSVSSISNSISNGCSPILFASSAVGQGANYIYQQVSTALGGADGTRSFTVQLSLVNLSGTSISHPAIKQVRLYVPIYQLTPTMEQQLLSLNRTKKIVYRDIMQYQVDVSGGDSVNTLLSNGIINPKTLILVPMIRGATSTTLTDSGANDGIKTGGSGGNITGYVATNGATHPSVAISCPTWQSPFSTEPSTSSPLCALTDLQILVSGQTIWAENEKYDFQQYINELNSINAINGNLITGLTSGLISEDCWTYMQRYYVVDLSRRLESENSVPKSIQVQAKNCSRQPITLFAFVEYEKSITIDLVSGAKIE